MKKAEKTKEQIIAEAQQVLQQDQQAKKQAFLDEYKKLCIKHEMELVAIPQITIQSIRK